MTFVVVATFIHLMIPVLDATDDIYFIKRKGAKAYFYYTGDLEIEALLRFVKKTIAVKLSPVYVLEAFGMYNGVTDISAYLPKEDKDAHPYYTNPKKELSDEELQEFLAKKGLK